MSNNQSRNGSGDIVIRRAGAADAPALLRLAQLEGRELVGRDALVAAVDGVVFAASSLDGKDVLADPFHPTAALVDLLRMRAGQVRSGRVGIARMFRNGRARPRAQARPTT